MTLLEILVVIILIGVVTSMVSLSLGLGGPQSQVEREARRLATLLKLQCEEAVLFSRELGLHLDRGGYHFSSWDGQEWRRREDAAQFYAHSLTPPLTVGLLLEGREMLLDADDQGPQVICSSSGEMTPFRVSFRLAEAGQALDLRGELDGKLAVGDWTGAP